MKRNGFKVCPLQNKLCYRTKHTAEVAAEFAARRRKRPQPYNVYQCWRCLKWHMTSQEVRIGA